MRIQITKLNIWITKIRKSIELTKVYLLIQNADYVWKMKLDGAQLF
jgi:hypothetical protein